MSLSTPKFSQYFSANFHKTIYLVHSGLVSRLSLSNTQQSAKFLKRIYYYFFYTNPGSILNLGILYVYEKRRTDFKLS